MQARFIGDPRNEGEGANALSLLGVDFVKGEWASVNAAQYAKLAGNDHFEVDGDENETPDANVDAMKAELTALGVKFHHKAGPAKLSELLAKARDEQSAH